MKCGYNAKSPMYLCVYIDLFCHLNLTSDWFMGDILAGSLELTVCGQFQRTGENFPCPFIGEVSLYKDIKYIHGFWHFVNSFD